MANILSPPKQNGKYISDKSLRRTTLALHITLWVWLENLTTKNKKDE
jgi:hypothetical protein